MTRDDKAALVQRFVEALNQGRFEDLEAIVAEDYIQHNPFVPQGREGLRAFFEGSLTAFEEGVGSVQAVLVEGDMIAARLRFEGVHVGDFLGVPATGRRIVFDTADFFRVENGMLAEHWDVSDWASVFHQMGVLPPLGPFGAAGPGGGAAER
ncbi:MAG: ester cyclase [Caulobacterales bacterium]|nr:ester cyclase [Caulobacterales bacterium]